MDFTDKPSDLHEPRASHNRRWTTTTWTTVVVDVSSTFYVEPTTTKHTRTKTLSTSTSDKDPWITKWVTYTVAGSAANPSWTTVVTSPTTTTTTTTLTPVPKTSETVTLMSTIENGGSSSPGGFGFGLVAFIGVLVLAVCGFAVLLSWLIHRRFESAGVPARSVVPVQVQGDGQGRDDFYGKA